MSARETSETPVIDAILARLEVEEDDDDVMDLLLGLLDDLLADHKPVDRLVNYLLTEDTDGDLWLITSGRDAVWERAADLVLEAADRIAPDAVIAALRHAQERVGNAVSEADNTLDACLEHIMSFAATLDVIPPGVVEALLQHPRGAVRLIGLHSLYQLDREAEALPYLRDPEAVVRVLESAWRQIPLPQLETLAANDPDDQVRQAATQAISFTQKYGAAPQP